jgi:alkylated DNA repair protein (DNA oxidative demethylase)
MKRNTEHQFGAPGDLFAVEDTPPAREVLGEGAVLLRAFAVTEQKSVLEAVQAVADASPFRHMITPGGYRMSVAMTNCGDVGWVSDPKGYRYAAVDPLTGQAWPAWPPLFLDIADRAAAEAGFPDFHPDACLINRYEPGAKLTLHQDKDEKDPVAPIVSFSFGLPATFLFGGLTRKDPPRRIRVESGDVAVWGGPSRFVYHGVAPLPKGEHPLTGPYRINLTFRKTT